MREHQKARAPIEAVRISQILTHRMIGKVSGPAEHPLLDDPRIRAHLEHFEIVIRLQNQAIGFAQVHFYQLRHIAEIGTDGDLHAIGAKGEGNGIGSVVRNRKGVYINIADEKMPPGLNRFDATQTLAEGFRQGAAQFRQSGLGDIQRRFP